MNEVLQNIKMATAIGLEPKMQLEIVDSINKHLCNLKNNLDSMEKLFHKAHKEKNLRSEGIIYAEEIVPLFDEIRNDADALEMLVDDAKWTLPKYREMMFMK